MVYLLDYTKLKTQEEQELRFEELLLLMTHMQTAFLICLK